MEELKRFVHNQYLNATYFPDQALIFMHNAYGAVQFAEQVGLVQYEEIIGWWNVKRQLFENLYTGNYIKVKGGE